MVEPLCFGQWPHIFQNVLDIRYQFLFFLLPACSWWSFKQLHLEYLYHGYYKNTAHSHSFFLLLTLKSEGTHRRACVCYMWCVCVCVHVCVWYVVCVCVWCICVMYMRYVCVICGMSVCVLTAHVWRSVDICRSWLFASWESHAGCQAYRQVPFIAEPSHQSFQRQAQAHSYF